MPSYTLTGIHQGFANGIAFAGEVETSETQNLLKGAPTTQKTKKQAFRSEP